MNKKYELTKYVWVIKQLENLKEKLIVKKDYDIVELLNETISKIKII